MVTIRQILCPIDFSEFSRQAFEHAMAIARWYESAVTLLHVAAVVPTTAYVPGDAILPPMRLTPEERLVLLTAMKEFTAAADRGGVSISFDVAQGSVAAEILAKAEAPETDLIVMGTHGRSGFERLVLGSVTDKIVRRAACPVLSVPPRARDAAPTVLFKRILCAVDFSDCSVQALNYAMSIAQETDAQLTLVHVIESPPRIPGDLHETTRGGPRYLRDYIAAAEEDARVHLAEAVPETVRTYCTVDSVIARGKPYEQILRLAAERSSDLIVIGIHGRGAVDLMFFGSTAQHVVRQAACPVLTLRRNGTS